MLARCVTFLTSLPSSPSLERQSITGSHTTPSLTHIHTHTAPSHYPTFLRNKSLIHFADDVDPRPAKFAFHPLVTYLHFSGMELDPAAVLHSMLPTHPDCRRKVYAPLCGHASASCAYATSPPVRSITLLRPDSESVIASVRNPDGCTMLDVNRLLGDLFVLFLMFSPFGLTDG